MKYFEEPGTLQELKDWIGLGFKLSQAAELYIGYIVTTAQADGGGSVERLKLGAARLAIEVLATDDRAEHRRASRPVTPIVTPPRACRSRKPATSGHHRTGTGF